MLPLRFISIDQNSTPLWDTVPKIAALVRQGLNGLHFVEDVDVAFTRHGAVPGDERVEVARERYYRGGTSDWGASLFYTDFLGRNPVDVREIEPYTGLTSKALARLLDITLDELYDRAAGSDNWQTIGVSYLGTADRHRTVGDLKVKTLKPCLRTLLAHAEENVCQTFPHPACRHRAREWFREERESVACLLEAGDEGRVSDLYRAWMGLHVPRGWDFDLTSELFRLDSAAVRQDPLHAVFLDHYEQAADLYNAAIEESGGSVAGLAKARGELPFFAVFSQDGRHYRSPVAIEEDTLHAGRHAWRLVRTVGGGRAFPYEAMSADGVTALVGKALILVPQACHCAGGVPLVVPHRGSVYMPAARLLTGKLQAAGLLAPAPWPVYRIRFGFLECLRELKVPVALPPYLHPFFGAPEMMAADFAEAIPQILRQAEVELEMMTSEDGRARVAAAVSPALAREIAEKEALQRTAAGDPATRGQASELWDQIKQPRRDLTWKTAERALALLHVRDLGYFDSRGALLPWSIALGGTAFYHHVLRQARVYPDTEGARG